MKPSRALGEAMPDKSARAGSELFPLFLCQGGRIGIFAELLAALIDADPESGQRVLGLYSFAPE